VAPGTTLPFTTHSYVVMAPLPIPKEVKVTGVPAHTVSPGLDDRATTGVHWPYRSVNVVIVRYSKKRIALFILPHNVNTVFRFNL
jgi:hypothetical protein